jgi:hypothetical protein
LDLIFGTGSRTRNDIFDEKKEKKKDLNQGLIIISSLGYSKPELKLGLILIIKTKTRIRNFFIQKTRALLLFFKN